VFNLAWVLIGIIVIYTYGVGGHPWVHTGAPSTASHAVAVVLWRRRRTASHCDLRFVARRLPHAPSRNNEHGDRAMRGADRVPGRLVRGGDPGFTPLGAPASNLTGPYFTPPFPS
jgi:hypothetical protein